MRTTVPFAILATLTLLLPTVLAHVSWMNEPFTDPTYVVTVTSGPTGTPCESFQERLTTQTWGPPPGGPMGPGAGPSHPMHTPGTAGGATGWHQAYALRVHRTIRTDIPGGALVGICGLAPPWVSSLTAEFQVFGGGALKSPTDVIHIQLTGASSTLASYAAASGAVITGTCTSGFAGVVPVGATGTCTLPPVPVSGSGNHDLRYVAHATNPTTVVGAGSIPSITTTFGFHTTPGPGTPGAPHSDRLNMTRPF